LKYGKLIIKIMTIIITIIIVKIIIIKNTFTIAYCSLFEGGNFANISLSLGIEPFDSAVSIYIFRARILQIHVIYDNNNTIHQLGSHEKTDSKKQRTILDDIFAKKTKKTAPIFHGGTIIIYS